MTKLSKLDTHLIMLFLKTVAHLVMGWVLRSRHFYNVAEKCYRTLFRNNMRIQKVIILDLAIEDFLLSYVEWQRKQTGETLKGLIDWQLI